MWKGINLSFNLFFISFLRMKPVSICVFTDLTSEEVSNHIAKIIVDDNLSSKILNVIKKEEIYTKMMKDNEIEDDNYAFFGVVAYELFISEISNMESDIYSKKDYQIPNIKEFVSNHFLSRFQSSKIDPSVFSSTNITQKILLIIENTNLQQLLCYIAAFELARYYEMSFFPKKNCFANFLSSHYLKNINIEEIEIIKFFCRYTISHQTHEWLLNMAIKETALDSIFTEDTTIHILFLEKARHFPKLSEQDAYKHFSSDNEKYISRYFQKCENDCYKMNEQVANYIFLKRININIFVTKTSIQLKKLKWDGVQLCEKKQNNPILGIFQS